MCRYKICAELLKTINMVFKNTTSYKIRQPTRLRIFQYYALFVIIILFLSASGRVWFPVFDVIVRVPIVIRVPTLFGHKRDLKGFLVE